MNDPVVTVHIDGVARGNPGPAACAFVIARPGDAVVERAERLGPTTNNVAEYTALLHALICARELGLRRLDIYSDSELLVKQINGDYNVKNADLKVLWNEARGLMHHFASVNISHIRREQNRRADELCNNVLDGRPPTAHRQTGRPQAATHPRKPPAAGLRPRVEDDALTCLQASIQAWKTGSGPSPEQVWDQLWSIIEEAGILKSKQKP